MSTEISIIVNGEPRNIGRGASLTDLLRSLDLDLNAGDQIELGHFVGGG